MKTGKHVLILSLELRFELTFEVPMKAFRGREGTVRELITPVPAAIKSGRVGYCPSSTNDRNDTLGRCLAEVVGDTSVETVEDGEVATIFRRSSRIVRLPPGQIVVTHSGPGGSVPRDGNEIQTDEAKEDKKTCRNSTSLQ